MWQLCREDDERQQVASFMLEHFNDLGLPYALETVLGSLWLAAEHGEMFIARRNDEVIGAICLTFGTDDGAYEDSENAEILLSYIVPKERNQRLFSAGLQTILTVLSVTEEIVFYSTPQHEQFRKFNNFATNVTKQCGPLVRYAVPTTAFRTLVQA